MNRRSLFDRATQLVEQAKLEKNITIRHLLLDTAARYYEADISKSIHMKPGIFWHWTSCIIFYVLVSAIVYIMGRELGLLAVFVYTVASYTFMVLAIGAILLMRGDIQERNFINVVREGFRSINILSKLVRRKTKET